MDTVWRHLPSLPLVAALGLLAGSASASPATLGIQAHPPVGGLVPLTVHTTSPGTTLGNLPVDAALRTDLTLALGTASPAPSVSASLQLRPVTPIDLTVARLTPYVGVGVTMLTFNDGAQASWLGRIGTDVLFGQSPFGLNAELIATRQGVGIAVGLVFELGPTSGGQR